MAEGLEIKLPFPGGAEEAIPVCFVKNGYCTTSAAHTLEACNFGNVDEDRRSCNVVRSDVVWG